MHRTIPFVLLFCSASMAQVTPGAMEEARQFVRSKLLGEADRRPARPHMMVYLRSGQIQKNRIGGRLFRIKDREFDRGIVMPSPGEVLVSLPGAGATFEAFVGVDSNDLGYYANQGRGMVEASVEVGAREAFRTPTMREGLPAIPVKVGLGGAKEFRLKLAAVGQRTRTYQAVWDQADWAMARATLADGRTVWLADLPVGPLAGPMLSDLPFSFRYGGLRSADLVKGWVLARSRRRLDEQRTEHTLAYSHPSSGLVVRCVAVEYHDFPAVEWTLYFANQGTTRTAIIEDIQALDTRLERGGEGEFVLHHSQGSRAEATDYQPFETPLAPKAEKKLASRGGRGTDGDLAYFNLAWPGRGAIVAVGWPGQWAAQFKRDEGAGIEIRAGQEQTHFRLMPGEEVRSPLMALVFWEGDWIAGQNVWRRWMVAHNLPRNRGKLHPPQIADGNGRHTIEMQDANEANQIGDLNRHLDAGVPMDYWWMDAGWYPFKEGWWNTGTWEPDPARLPRGFKPISEAAHARGVKILVWFEPERVTAGSWLDQNHPEWLLKRGEGNRLLDLGNDEARRWLTDHVSKMIREQGIDLYRQDFNFEPLNYWRGNDTEDRQGLTEIKHLTGYLAFWDELRRRFPDLPIDTCASGGRRNDLETLRRGLPLWRSDHAYEPISMQGLTYGLALWVPYYGTGINSLEPYIFRSQMTPAVGIGLDPGNYPDGYQRLKRLCDQWRKVAEYYFGDYYPLTPYSLEKTEWMAWQFDAPDKGEGMVQAFRRPECPYEVARFKLRGLDAGARYTVKDLEAAGEAQFTGRELMETGMPVAIKDRPGAAIVVYKKRT